MDIGAVLIAVTGVAGTLGGALLTQRGADRAKRRELETAQALQEARENRELRRRCYAELHRDARQFATSISRHLYVLRDREAGPDDVRVLEETKDAFRDRWSEALMIAPDPVVAPAHEVNAALTAVYGRVKRWEQGRPGEGETLRSAAEAQRDLWTLIETMRDAMRADLGVTGATTARPRRAPERGRSVVDDFPEPDDALG
ncbi:hypothetical protein ABZ439_22715 [Streptomyces sp. NPDC005840]|uniref:Secreted protein n=1 Tax=Streptomyces doudnae TaxID=3075536 RepID=A0ABD5EN26_9ACTN|nr:MULTISPECIES: hypothetical protein [unclassified Streptomyces]MDT0436011.1 hypothetical protein [Streptomyces sp. DSM 41981]SCD81186.1 hypothetical protein GA0115242_11518 [Streptomyces sp. SolWspMP-5a-2]